MELSVVAVLCCHSWYASTCLSTQACSQICLDPDHQHPRAYSEGTLGTIAVPQNVLYRYWDSVCECLCISVSWQLGFDMLFWVSLHRFFFFFLASFPLPSPVTCSVALREQALTRSASLTPFTLRVISLSFLHCSSVLFLSPILFSHPQKDSVLTCSLCAVSPYLLTQRSMPRRHRVVTWSIPVPSCASETHYILMAESSPSWQCGDQLSPNKATLDAFDHRRWQWSECHALVYLIVFICVPVSVEFV